MADLYKTEGFAKRAKGLTISDEQLCEAAKLHREKLKAGDNKTRLGGNIFKLRLAVGPNGKRDGARSVVASALGHDVFFIFCYSKNDVPGKGGAKELPDSIVNQMAHEGDLFLKLDAAKKEAATKAGILIKVKCDGLC